MKKRRQTGFLYSTPSFLSGVGSVMNIAGDFYEYNTCENPDHTAIYNDFAMVGQDIKDAFEKIRISRENLAAK